MDGEPTVPPRPASVIEVAISRGEGGAYRTEVLRSEVGEAAVVVDLDVASLMARRADLRRAVLASAAASGRARAESDEPLREVGRQLFAALLGSGEVASLYRASAARAVDREQELRVVIRINDPVLAGLPWEAMHDEANKSYVCRQHQLVRHVGVPSAAAPLLVNPPLRILAVASSPRGWSALDVNAEKRHMASALSRLTGAQRPELVWTPSAAWADLQEALLDGPWHVLHFIGHGKFEASLEEGALALTADNGEADWVEASRLVSLLNRARPIPRLVVLNSCSGATTGPTDMFSSTAAALVRGGVTAVAAMQYEFSDPAAAEFTRGFYSSLAHGRGVDDAVSNGRVAIIGINGRTLEWVTPVLYLRGSDSHLFTIPAARPQTEVRERATRPGDPAPDSRPAPWSARLIRTLSRHTASPRCLAFSPSGDLLASAGDDPGVQLWQVPGGSNVGTVPARTRTITGLAFSPDGQVLASAGTGDRFVWLWEAATGRQVRRLAGHTAGVLGVAFSPDGGWIASGGSDQSVRLWKLPSGVESRVLTGPTGTVRSVAFSPDGGWIASGGSDQSVRLWKLPSGAESRTLAGHARAVTSLAFSPSQPLLAAAAGAAVHLWDPETGAFEGTLTGHAGLVYSVAFSPRGRLLASGGGDGTVSLWDASAGRKLQQLTGHQAAVTCVAFSPDGHLLASAGSDHIVRLWELPAPEAGTN